MTIVMQTASANSSPEPKDPIEELDEELRREYGACTLCGKRTLAREGERVWCKNCGWKKEAKPEASVF